MGRHSQFACPKCGCESFKPTIPEPKTKEDFIGAACADCSYRLTRNDIDSHFFRFAERLAADFTEGKKPN